MDEYVTPHGAEAYAALVHIEAGHWDPYLLRLFHALRARLDTDEVRDSWVKVLKSPTVEDM
jgi:hypothetical protein